MARVYILKGPRAASIRDLKPWPRLLDQPLALQQFWEM
jgi:hypothetical protein